MEKSFLDSINYTDGIVVYEVIRVINGIPLFLEEHLIRFNNSAMLAELYSTISNTEISNSIKQLCTENQVFTGNVKLLLHSKNKQHVSFLCFFIKHMYPVEIQYQKGVKLMLYNAERKNPNAKIADYVLRETTEDILSKSKVYELLLVNKSGRITEGSKSNVFFIKDNTLYTAPKSLILSGITRKFILKTAQLLGITVIEEAVLRKNIRQYDAAFISGTSPKILPISSIDNVSYNVKHPLIHKLIELFNEEIENYIYNNS